ncbi:hypothetical protein CLV94_1107 [Flavobacterium endophyticum]|uniref:Restriction endonuclease n=1 Tax=Flavobacterium endophyticum TaxID=1540163 RepID=A0A495ML25_9FLAO|nr:hypothetical protein [Flavobacterium endophyticum]RKS26055.1 hypothetical protein CLV94_1107 [Flavobacterium endophyticum]
MHYQLPIPKSPEVFESLVCDLLNAVHNTTSFSLYGRRGQSQNGIDIISPEKKIASQCKLRNLNLNSNAQKVNFINEIIDDINAILKTGTFPRKLIIATSLENDVHIQNLLNTLAYKHNLPFSIEYWSWDYISNNLFLFSHLVNKYYPFRNNFIEIARIEVLSKKIYRQYETNKMVYEFHDDRSKNILPVFDISFINNSENTILLNSIDILAQLLPVAFAGRLNKPTGILKVTKKFNAKLVCDLAQEGKNTIELEDPIYAYPKALFRIQIQLTEPIDFFVKVRMAFNFSTDTIISPDFYFNSDIATTGELYLRDDDFNDGDIPRP